MILSSTNFCCGFYCYSLIFFSWFYYLFDFLLECILEWFCYIFDFYHNFVILLWFISGICHSIAFVFNCFVSWYSHESDFCMNFSLELFLSHPISAITLSISNHKFEKNLNFSQPTCTVNIVFSWFGNLTYF